MLCFHFDESESDRKKSICGQPHTYAFLRLPYHLRTNKTEEAEVFHYENKNTASEMLIFSDSLSIGS